MQMRGWKTPTIQRKGSLRGDLTRAARKFAAARVSLALTSRQVCASGHACLPRRVTAYVGEWVRPFVCNEKEGGKRERKHESRNDDEIVLLAHCGS